MVASHAAAPGACPRVGRRPPIAQLCANGLVALPSCDRVSGMGSNGSRGGGWAFRPIVGPMDCCDAPVATQTKKLNGCKEALPDYFIGSRQGLPSY